MKYKTKQILAFMCMGTIFLYRPLCAVLTVSQYKPDSFFQTPYFVQDDFASISTIFSGGFASQAFNQNSKKVPYLQQFGAENFLKKFIDTSLPDDSTDSFGQGLLDGTFHVREIILSCYKNMNQGFFIEGGVVLQDLLINSISAQYIPSSKPLTDNQSMYLQALQQKIPANIGQSGMFTTACYGGYSHSFSNFTNIDFIDLTIKTGFMSPQAMTNNNSSFIQLPFYGNMNFGYPIISAASIGILDWLTIGCTGSVIPWQSTTKTIPLLNNLSNNTLLGMESGCANIKRAPLLATSIYFQADHFHQNLSTVVGYSYTYNGAYSIKPLDASKFSQELANQSQLTHPWSFGSLYLQFDVDFAKHSNPNAPVIAVFCNIPVRGTLCPKTTIFGSSCNLQISYKF